MRETDLSCTVLAFSDSVKAWNYLERALIKPDIISLDINMPILSGAQLLQLIRKNVSFSDTPIVMYSTSIDEKSFMEFYMLGANAFLKKPLRFESIAEGIRETLRKVIKTRPSDMNVFPNTRKF